MAGDGGGGVTGLIAFDERVAIVIGAGRGLGRSHAIALAARGARVVVNDLGAELDGTGSSPQAAHDVATEIEAAGGEALADGADVTNPGQVAAMVADVMKRWGRVDILVNNSGMLRDRTFSNMELDDFRIVLEVHLMGTVTCTKAVWQIMRDQGYGRIVMTASSSGLYGNFGQANYGAAKMSMVGLMNVLHLEGQKHDIRVNTLAPAARSRMTEGLIPDHALALLTPESVSPGVLYLVGEDAPSRTILAAGAGGYAVTKIYETEGISLPPGQQTPENIAARFDEIADPEGQVEIEEGSAQTVKFVTKADQHQPPA